MQTQAQIEFLQAFAARYCSAPLNVISLNWLHLAIALRLEWGQFSDEGRTIAEVLLAKNGRLLTRALVDAAAV